MVRHVKLHPLEMNNVDKLSSIHISEKQNRYVRFCLKTIPYEISSNPWAFSIDVTDTCVGYLYAEQDNDLGLHIHKLVISEEIQRQGIGTAALHEFTSLARIAGIQTIFLSVAYANTGAAQFYKRFGFIHSALGVAEAGCNLFSLSLEYHTLLLQLQYV